MNREDKWLLEFVILVIFSALFSGIAYYLQGKYLKPPSYDPYFLLNGFIRMIRMILFYIFPVLWFIRRHDGNWRDLCILPSKKYPILSLIGGISVYIIAVVVFLKYRIFFGGWALIPWKIIIPNLIFIFVMASITDFWTRGFILMQLANRYNEKIAIFWQNVTWFIIHIYEIVLLNQYISYYGAILLTLTLGIGGDLIALRTKSITGLMLGHMVLNLCVVLAAKDVIML